MNYEQLFGLLPKTHWQWTIEDTKRWLSFIGLQSLQQKFQHFSIDGSILDGLNQEDFNKELKIESRIIVKKLMNWITHGIPEFDRFVETQNRFKGSAKQNELFLDVLLKSKPSMKEEKEREVKSKPREATIMEPSKRYEANELIIKQLEQNQVGNFVLKEKGGMIGRHAQNEIVILDEFVSRYHAEIIYDQEQYYIKDCGSSSGTFIRIAEKYELKNGMVIEMGSNQFEVNLDKAGNLVIKVIDGPNQDCSYPLYDQEVYSVGRKQSNHISFPDDQHLSGIHSKFFKIKGQWFIEDIATTNGTWLRLSREGDESAPHLLEDKCQFKLSSNLIYECKLNSNNRRTFKSGQQKCVVCKTDDKNSIVMPCKHAAGCENCLMKEQLCPICSIPIKSVIKMYTA